jgi:hypothetical protein
LSLKIVLTILGVVLLLGGLLWMGQGAGLIHDRSAAMDFARRVTGIPRRRIHMVR